MSAPLRRFCALFAVFAISGCGGHTKKAQSTAAPEPKAVATLLIDSKGVVMPLSLATRTLAFRPFIPPGQVVQTAVIPPLNVDQQKNHGLAIEYVAGDSAVLLSQWPKAGFEVPPASMNAGPCVPVPYKSDGLLWYTGSGVVMTLQPDGHASPSRVSREARRLLQLGACGKPL